MASRYGRKKRRAHREMIEQLSRLTGSQQARLQKEMAEASAARNQLEQFRLTMQHWDDDVRHLLGQFTALALEPAMMSEDYAGHVRQLPVYPHVTRFAGPTEIANVEEGYVEGYVETIYRAVSNLSDADLMTMKRYMRMRIVCGKDVVASPKPYDWAYAVSESLFKRGLAERDIIHVAEQIAVKFHERMRAELGRANGR